MTPIGHLASGAGAGGLVSPLLNKFFKIPYRALALIFLISSVLPDIDAASLLFNHKIYYGKMWFSHHMMAHSFLGAALFSVLISIFYITGAISIRGIINLFRKDKIPLEARIKRFIGAMIAAFIGCLAHFAGDLPTPPGPWKGIALFWPSDEMYGGWSRIYWHNWYIIYISIVFMIYYFSSQILAGFFSSIKTKYTKWTGYSFRAISVIISIVFIFKLVGFIQNNNYKTMGYNKWENFNKSLVPKEYLKKADEYQYKATVLWRETLISKEGSKKLYLKFIDAYNNFCLKLGPKLAPLFVDFNSDDDELALYKALQGIQKGMEDNQPGDYRMWVFRDLHPEIRFYDRAFLYRLVARLNNKLVWQITNSQMIIFRIDKRDDKGNALKVSRIYHSNKIYVPDRDCENLNMEEVGLNSLRFWRHDKIPYNLIPRLSYSMFGTTVRGLFPSLNTTPGFISPGIKTGIAIHSGMFSAGCTVAVFGHLDLGEHIQNSFHPIWVSADKIIDITKDGSLFRSREKVWGRVLYLKDPEPVRI